jgi:hypothetical protein
MDRLKIIAFVTVILLVGLFFCYHHEGFESARIARGKQIVDWFSKHPTGKFADFHKATGGDILEFETGKNNATKPDFTTENISAII